MDNDENKGKPSEGKENPEKDAPSSEVASVLDKLSKAAFDLGRAKRAKDEFESCFASVLESYRSARSKADSFFSGK